MNGTEPQVAEARRWIAKACEDRRSAALILAADPPMTDPAAYHCQQAAEKLLKALLAGLGMPIPRSHDLKRLAAETMPHHPALAADMEAISDLTPWATATRYPDLESDLGITVQDIRDALIVLERLERAITTKIQG